MQPTPPAANQPSGLKDNQIVVLIIPDNDYVKSIISLTKELNDGGSKICYITLNRPYRSIHALFEKNGMDMSKFFFIDAITKTAEMAETTENCEFVSSPSALTELSLSISNILEREKFDYMIFDSLSTLLVYESETVITKFVHFLIAKVRVIGCNALFTCLKQDTGSILIRDINMFADKILDMEKLNLDLKEWASK